MSYVGEIKRPEDWQAYLADPHNQWKKGYSARTLAYCWMEAGGFPYSVKKVFQQAQYDDFKGITFAVGFVERKVFLPGGGHPSQNDILVLAKNKKDLLAIAVEGKVDESFGQTVEDWLKRKSKGKEERLSYLSSLFQLNQMDLLGIRYQFLHRAASALKEAERFNASAALMLVHSFSLKQEGFDDYASFASLFGVTARLNAIDLAKRIEGVNLYLAWVTGEREYLTK